MSFWGRFFSFVFVLILAAGSLSMTAFAQAEKPKPAAAKPKPKPASAKPKTSDTKSKTATQKPKATPSKAASAGAGTDAKAAKPEPKTPAKATANKDPKAKAPAKATAEKKPKPAEQVPVPDEKAEWDKATTVAELPERIKAIRAFLTTFPNTEKRAEAGTLLALASAELGNASLIAGDLAGASLHFKTAAADAPTPIPDQLFGETLAKFAPNLFFRGARADAFEISSTLEKKAGENAGQLLAIAEFYMSVENGGEARRLAEAAIKVAPSSSAAYQTLGLANRIDFRLDESAAAYSKALELDPESLQARRGLAEMKRSLGKADEATVLYQEILTRDQANIPAQTGLILSLFDSGKVTEAEAELAKATEANGGNVILLAGAAYWYAANRNGEKAVSLAQKAIAADPRFIWSHIALARGYLNMGDPLSAEKTLVAARRYGNFPTLEYEIASARVAAGFFREGADELAKSFSAKDGVIHTNLGGRIARESKDFTELIGYERRASIFAPTAADSPESAARLTALLELKQLSDAAEPKPEAIAKAADDFVRGDDKMKVHRQLFAANRLLEKKVALAKAVELAKSAVAGVDAGLEVRNPSVAVMAAELYENRALAASRGEYLNVPEVPRQTLSSIMRGQIEEIAGWALYQNDSVDEAIVRLKRAVSVLPADSIWWRSSTWRLGTALAKTGKDVDALDWMMKSYKGAQPNAFSYSVIEDLYKKVTGSTDGLETKIGPKPALPVLADTVAKVVTPSPTPEPTAQPSAEATPAASPAGSPEPPVAASPSPSASPLSEQTPSPTPDETKPSPTPAATPAVVPVFKPAPSPTVEPVVMPSATPTSTPESAPTPEKQAATSPEPITSPSPTPEVVPSASTTPTPEAEKPATATPELTPSPSPSESPSPSLSPTPEATPSPEKQAAATPEPTPSPSPSPSPEKAATTLFKDLFPPVVISIPRPTTANPAAASPTPSPSPESAPKPAGDEPKSSAKPPSDTAVADGRPRVVVTDNTASPVVTPCKLTVSEETVTLESGGGDLAVIVGRVDDLDLDGITAISSSPDNVSVRREQIPNVKARALFVLRATGKAGVYQVTFEMPCGKKGVVIRVR